MHTLLNNRFFVILLAPFLLGAITTIGFSPYNFTFINFFSFSILLFLILTIKKKTKSKYRKKKKKWNFFYLGCAFGFGFFLFGNYWIAISLTHDDMFKTLIPYALIIIPLFLSLFFGLVTFIIGPYAEKNISYILLFSITFSIFEYIRGNILTGFPWNLISYSFVWSIESIQILSKIGTYSLSLISLTFFCTPFLFISNRIAYKNIIFLLILITLFIWNFFYGLNKIDTNNYNFDDKINVKIISPNFSLKEYNEISEITLIKRLIKISDPQKNNKTLFIWPEGIFYESYLKDIGKYKKIFEDNFSKNHLIILGVNSLKGKKYFNSLVVLNNKLEVLSLYNKMNLVPFGEFLPFEKILFKLGYKKITRGYNSFSEGSIRSEIDLGKIFNNKLVIPLICYEIIYPGEIKNKNQFPDLVVNISEDGWFGESIGPYQHFSKSIYRSIEEGVFIARSANKGFSAFINPNGEVLKSLNMGESGNIELNFPYFSGSTLFSNYGNKIFALIIFFYIFLILILRKFKI